MSASPTITPGKVLRYSATPQILPRLKKLFGSGFINLPYFIVVVFNTLRIIPNNHIYLRRESHGQFSLLQALAAAANHIPFNKKNIDKIAIFGVVLTGIAMVFMQIFLLGLALFSGRAFAYNGPGLGPTTVGAFINNPNTQDDIAFRLLDLVFGIPNLFNSKNMGTTPFHSGLHALFEFYSFGMLLIATIILIYLAIAVVLETAESGIPFGKRFNKSWAAIRVVLFFGLLLPTPQGINLAQYLVLNAAMLGSNVASNAWITFDSTSKSAYLGNPSQLIAEPNIPDFTGFASFMVLAKMCSWAEGRINMRDIQPYLVYGKTAAQSVPLSSAPAFSTVVNNVKGGNVSFRFGVKDPVKYIDETGAIYPYCGELVMPIVDQAQPGAAYIQQAYIEMVDCMWSGTSGSAFQCNLGNRFDMIGQGFTEKYGRIPPYNDFPNMTLITGQSLRTFVVMSLNNSFKTTLANAITQQTNPPSSPTAPNSFANPNVTLQGWGGAGIWFNKVAEQNGALTSSVFNEPQIRLMPSTMEWVKKQKLQQDANVPFLDTYTPYLSNGDPIYFEIPEDRKVVLTLNQQFRYWASDQTMAFYLANPVSHNTGNTGNIIIDTINVVMGTQGLFDMCKNTNIHPLAQLSALGRGLVEHSIRSFGIAAGVGVVGGLAGLFDKSLGAALQAATGFFINIASIGLILGLILFYVLPMIPFIYFFFAVMTWVKSIFEAMVGMPLWALAHLRIDGEGMPGDSAESGYFYILEIFLRPILIIISFLGGIIIFGSMVKVLNQIFYLVLSNLAGHTPGVSSTNCFTPPQGTAPPGVTEVAYKRGPIDEFFFTVIYTIIVYLIALPCFKLVDMIPDHVVSRWLRNGLSTFGSQDGDPAANMVRNVAAGAGSIGGKLKDGGSGFGFFR